MSVKQSVTLDDEGLITGYASLFNIPDDVGDIVEKGAFNKCIVKKGVETIRLLWQHDASEPIGKWLHIYEDEVGLRVTGQICLETQKGRDVRALLKSGVFDGLSIGFKAVKSRKVRNEPYRRLSEIDLWEISLVTFPALKGARVEAVKSLHLTYKEFDPNQPRDENGRWTSGGASSGASGGDLGGSDPFAGSSGGSSNDFGGDTSFGGWSGGGSDSFDNGSGSDNSFGEGSGGTSNDFGSDNRIDLPSNDLPESGDKLTGGEGNDRYSVDIKKEEGGSHNGHTIAKHVGHNPEAMRIKHAQDVTFKEDPVSGQIVIKGPIAVSTFKDLESAQLYVNDALQNNKDEVDRVATGEITINHPLYVGYDEQTGWRSYRNDPIEPTKLEKTFGAITVIRHDPFHPRGFRLITAFPVTKGNRQ